VSANKVTSTGFYIGIFLALLGLTLLTTWTANMDLGHWHVPVALGIAVTKTTLVVLFFMHLIHSPKLTWMVAASGVVTWIIMVVFTLSDYVTRPMLPLGREAPPGQFQPAKNIVPTENQ
jgi:cytochrome c oxidase subunit 4